MKTLQIFLLLFVFANSTLYSQTNTYYGAGAGNGTNGNENSSFGYQAGDVATGIQNVYVGHFAGLYSGNKSYNTYLGAYSGVNSTSGDWGTFIGCQAGRDNAGSYNVFIGAEAGIFNQSGHSNTFVGTYAASSNKFGVRNSCFGRGAGSSMEGSDNIFIGYKSGEGNVAGNYNIMVGNNAGHNSTGSSNVFIGHNVGDGITVSNKLYIDNANVATPLIYGDFTANTVGINTTSGTYTLNVGGTINSTGGIYVNDQLITGDLSFWTKSGSNLYNLTESVGIGTDLSQNPFTYRLAVNGKIGAHELQIENDSQTWPDFVFDKNYDLPPLEEVEEFITVNRHLPNIPSEKEVKENGILVGEMNARLLQKIEELTLYVIELKKEVEQLKAAGSN